MAGGVSSGSTHEVTCPHCRKSFEAALIEGGPARHRGFKCPHCKLFVPADRAADAAIARDPGA
jgi:transposase